MKEQVKWCQRSKLKVQEFFFKKHTHLIGVLLDRNKTQELIEDLIWSYSFIMFSWFMSQDEMYLCFCQPVEEAETEHYSELQNPPEDVYSEARFYESPAKIKTGMLSLKMCVFYLMCRWNANSWLWFNRPHKRKKWFCITWPV